jgi:hypothetical protein
MAKRLGSTTPRRRASHVRVTCLFEPYLTLGVANEVVQPPEKAISVPFAQPIPGGERCDLFGERSGVVIDVASCLRHDAGDRLRTFMIGEQIGGYSRWPGRGDSVKLDPENVGDVPARRAVSHRSAAAVYGVGDLPADRHDFAP